LQIYGYMLLPTLLLRSLDCFISRPISTTLYRCYFAFFQSSLNEYEWMNECSAKVREFPRPGQLFCTTYGCGATRRQNFSIFGFWPISPCKTPKKYLPVTMQPTAQGLHDRMIAIFRCGSRRSKGVHSGSELFLPLMVRELGTRKFA